MDYWFAILGQRVDMYSSLLDEIEAAIVVLLEVVIEPFVVATNAKQGYSFP